ncbi:MAG: GTP 3',8-cyclase MoaA [Acidobacteriota bacterium]|nr:GTP 3',8-cyclase MoaA [Acidobacteriota bacterium]
MVLTDTLSRPLQTLRVSVTDRCNFRCPYCMPREVFPADYPFLGREEILHYEEIERLVAIFAAKGVRKVRLTGGEPLLRKALPDLVRRLARVRGVEDLALTTNGALLAEAANPLKEAGLHRLTVSLDTLDGGRFRNLGDTEIPLQRVLSGLEAARSAGFGPIKLNCVLQRGINDDEILDLATFAREAGHILRFIEFMDVGTRNGWKLDAVVPADEVLARISERWNIEPVEESQTGRVAERWRYRDGAGEFGIIASVTKAFCGGCDRARLSAEGALYTCLFAGEGVNLKTALRNGASDSDIGALIASTWKRRDDRYSELRGAATAPARKVEMFHIGG